VVVRRVVGALDHLADVLDAMVVMVDSVGFHVFLDT
jgi:hypothetical protein